MTKAGERLSATLAELVRLDREIEVKLAELSAIVRELCPQTRPPVEPCDSAAVKGEER